MPNPLTPEPKRSTLVLPCGEAIDGLDEPPADYASVLDVVAFDKRTLEIYPDGTRKFAKSGLVLRRSAKFEIEVRWARRSGSCGAIGENPSSGSR